MYKDETNGEDVIEKIRARIAREKLEGKGVNGDF